MAKWYKWANQGLSICVTFYSLNCKHPNKNSRSTSRRNSVLLNATLCSRNLNPPLRKRPPETKIISHFLGNLSFRISVSSEMLSDLVQAWMDKHFITAVTTVSITWARCISSNASHSRESLLRQQYSDWGNSWFYRDLSAIRLSTLLRGTVYIFTFCWMHWYR
jgi:hypothetical protein